jgi:hypothetical protein
VTPYASVRLRLSADEVDLTRCGSVAETGDGVPPVSSDESSMAQNQQVVCWSERPFQNSFKRCAASQQADLVEQGRRWTIGFGCPRPRDRKCAL